jgi:hypothetical protein
MPNLTDTGLGRICLAPYYSNTGSITFWGESWRAGTNILQDVRWRVFWSASADMADQVRAFKKEAPLVDSVTVTQTPGYFQGCIINYEGGAPPVDFGIVVAQHS